MSHPSLVRLNAASRPRVLFAGQKLTEVALPVGTQVLYSRAKANRESAEQREKRKEKRGSISSVAAQLVEQALAQPLGAETLKARLRPGQRVSVLLDPSFLPARASTRDPRSEVLEVLLREIEGCGVRDVEVLVACGLERRRSAKELVALLGRDVVKRLGASRVACHDVEADDLSALGPASDVNPVRVARRVAESNLVITLSVHGGGYAGFSGPVLRGVGDVAGYLRAAEAGALSDALPEERAAFDRLPLFALELVLDGPRFAARYDFLSANEDDLSIGQRRAYGVFRGVLRRLPELAQQALLDETLAPPTLEAVFAGDAQAARQAAQQAWRARSEVPVAGQADVLVAAVPHRAGCNVGSFLNPLLVSAFAHAGLASTPGGTPLVKAGGTLVLLHPCTDFFDRQQHAAYTPFFNEALSRTRELPALKAWTQAHGLSDPALVQLFRNGAAYHPAHAYVAWAHGALGRAGLSRVIVVGADNEYVPRALGFETTQTLDQALYRARAGLNTPQEILCLHAPLNSQGVVA